MASGGEAEGQNASSAPGQSKNPNNALHNHSGQVLDAGLLPLYSSKRKQKFLSALPSLESTQTIRDFTGFRRSTSALDDDGAASEWETIAPANELASQINLADSLAKHRARNVELVFHAQDILPGSSSNVSLGGRRNTIAGLLDHPAQRLPVDKSHLNLPTHQSFCSSSSFYSDTQGYDDRFIGSRLSETSVLGPTRTGSRRRPATLGVDHNLAIELGAWRCSKASSSTCGDPFKYDGATYSAFLQPAAERDVSSALHRVGASLDSVQTTHPFQTDHTSSLKQNRIENASFYNSEAIRST